MADQSSPVQFTDQHQKDLINNIQTHVKEATGEDHQVAPTTADSPIDQIEKLVEQAINSILPINNNTKSKSFKTKLIEKLKLRHPNSQIKEGVR